MHAANIGLSELPEHVRDEGQNELESERSPTVEDKTLAIEISGSKNGWSELHSSSNLITQHEAERTLDDLEAGLVAGVDFLSLSNLCADSLADALGNGSAIEELGDHGGRGRGELSNGGWCA